ELSLPSRRAPRQPRAGHARQRRASVGDPARGDEARRGGGARDHAALSHGPRGSPAARQDRPGRCRRRGGGPPPRPWRQPRAAGAVGGGVPGWRADEDAAAEPADFPPESRTAAQDPLLLYCTSGTTAKPKLVLHTQQSYPVGHLSTMYWIGLREGDRHLNISS